MIKLSCTNTMLPNGSLLDKARSLRAWGFSGISIFIDYGDWNAALEDEVLQLPDKTGISICEFAFEGAVHGHGGLMSKDPEMRNKARQLYRKAAKICAALGAVTEVEYEYRAQRPIPLLHPYKKMNESEERDFIEMYQEILQEVEGSDAFVLIEPINRYESPYLNCIADTLEIVHKTANPYAGILADFFHMSIEEKSIPEGIMLAGETIKHVHLGDNNRMLPGLGGMDWEANLGALKDAGYDRYVNFECCVGGDPAVTLPAAVEYIARYL